MWFLRNEHDEAGSQSGQKSTKPVWKCRIATNRGIANCPHSKAIDEKIIEDAFLDMFRLLSDNFDDVLESVLQAVENSLANDDNAEKLKRVEKEIAILTRKKKKLTGMYLDDKISKEDYDAKDQELSTKLNASMREKEYFSEGISSKEVISERMRSIRKRLKEADVDDEFDRIVFESIVEQMWLVK